MRQILKDARTTAGMTQKETANAIKVSERFYQHLEAGTREGKGHIWDELEALFNTPQRELRNNDSHGNYSSSEQNGVAEAKELNEAAQDFMIDVETILDIGEDGRDTLELIDTQSAEISALRQIVASKDVQIDRLISAVEDLNKNRLEERSEWQQQVGSLTNKNTALDKKLAIEQRKRWGIGPFGGIAHTGESVIGIGITYDIIKF